MNSWISSSVFLLAGHSSARANLNQIDVYLLPVRSRVFIKYKTLS
jgi:hypothetical protein